MKLASMLCQKCANHLAISTCRSFVMVHDVSKDLRAIPLHTHPTPHDWLHSQKWFRFGLLLVHHRPIDNSLAVVLAFWVVELLRNGEPPRLPCHMSDIWTYRPNHLGIKDVIPNRCFTPSRKAVSIQFHFLESLVRILWKLCNLCTQIRKKASKKTINKIGIFATPNRNPWRDQPPAEPSLKLPGVTKITVLGLMAPRFFPQKSKVFTFGKVQRGS